MASMAMAAFSAMGPAMAGAGAGSAMAGASSAASVMQGVSSAGSVLSGFMQASETLRAGEAAANDATFRADLALAEGDRAATQSAARADDIKREALRKVGAARVAFSASGLAMTSGQLSAVEGALGKDAAYGIGLENEVGRMAVLEASMRAGQYRSQADNARSSGRAAAISQAVGAGVQGSRGLLSIARRG